ncbi:hypothetical protein HanRHA438_Chr02g0051701 [Helianthus annuus]|nr:hypothetical protein HanRHA438_Chr02g0051701 [Helianthus annuus]
MGVRLHAPSWRMDYSHSCLCLGSWVLLCYVTCFIVICCHVCLVSVVICLICLYASGYVQYLLSVQYKFWDSSYKSICFSAIFCIC